MQRVSTWVVLAALLVIPVGSAEAVPCPIEGKKLLIRNGSRGNKVMFLSRDYWGISLPTSGKRGDPRCFAEGGGGGALRLKGDGGDVTIPLPCAGWSSPDHANKYRYKDPTRATCTLALVIDHRLVKVVCKGPQVAYGLGAAQGDIYVALEIGSHPYRYCTIFGPAPTTIKRDGSNGRTYLALSSPAPSACDGSPSAAFLDVLSSLIE